MIEQIGIACTGVVAIFLSQDKRESWRRWACIFGLAGQPFWFYSAYKAGQWGIFALCCLYAFSWARGFWNHWLHPKPAGMTPERFVQSAEALLDLDKRGVLVPHGVCGLARSLLTEAIVLVKGRA